MVREGSAPNFCPPTEEGVTIALVDEKGEQVELEFLGLVLKGESSFGFFFPIDDEHPATSSGEVPGGRQGPLRLRLGLLPRMRAPMILVTDPDHGLTLREQQILYYIAGGLSNKEIAGRLTLSEQTVKAHLSHMTAKSGRANRAALVTYGFETGILRRC